MKKDEFLYPIYPYYGHFESKYKIFNCKLQKFSTKITYISGLVGNNKISPIDAYEQIELLCTELENLANELDIND